MKTVTTTIYKFDELTPSAQQKAIEQYRNDGGVYTDFIYDDAYESVKKFNDVFGIKEGRHSWLDYNTGHIDDAILELKGERLRTYIINNFYSTFYERKKYGKRKSRIIYTETSCPLTGICYDCDLLKPFNKLVYKYNHDTHSHVTFEMLISDAFESLRLSVESEADYQNSDEAIIESIQANDYNYTEDGKMFSA